MLSETKGRISKKKAREIAGAAWDSGFDAGWRWGLLAALLLSLALFWIYVRLSNGE
jgi:hypothetical protein